MIVVSLFRSGDESDPYEAVLAEYGYRAVCIPVLEFDLVNQEALREALEHPRSYDGLVFTSPRAVDAVASAMPWLPTENIVWHSKDVFAVGPRTASELRQIGFEPTGEGSGSAELLAQHITSCEFENPLLFLCGNRRRDDLPEALQQAGIAFEELCVYESRAKEKLELHENPPADWMVFFSPSGVSAVLAGGDVDLRGARLAAIGQTTASALREQGLDVAAVAGEPTPDALAQAISTADRPI